MGGPTRGVVHAEGVLDGAGCRAGIGEAGPPGLLLRGGWGPRGGGGVQGGWVGGGSRGGRWGGWVRGGWGGGRGGMGEGPAPPPPPVRWC